MNDEFMIVAGEASGDLHGGRLAAELKKLDPDCRLFGIGGDKMSQAGVELTYHVNDLGVTGFTEVAGKFRHILKAFKWAVRAAIARRPNAVILIDYPDFNLRLASRIRKMGISVVYFVSPQLWAWRSGRVKRIARDVNRMLVLFPFEKDWYEARGVRAVYVGNPVVDGLSELPDRESSRRQLGLTADRSVIGMLPGSRRNEVARLLPVMCRAWQLLKSEFPDLHGIVSVAPTIRPEWIAQILKQEKVENIEISRKPSALLMRAADLVWVASGTATLETALAETPMIVLYRTSWLSYLLASMLVKVPYISMTNLVAGSAIVPELIQHHASPGRLVDLTRSILQNPEESASIKSRLRTVREKLGESGASRRAATEILKLCHTLPADVANP